MCLQLWHPPVLLHQVQSIQHLSESSPYCGYRAAVNYYPVGLRRRLGRNCDSEACLSNMPECFLVLPELVQLSHCLLSRDVPRVSQSSPKRHPLGRIGPLAKIKLPEVFVLEKYNFSSDQLVFKST